MDAIDAIDAIQRRTSVRRFRPDPVPRETLARLLECAVRAPNHKLTEPWRFTVVTGPARGRLAGLRARHRLERYSDPESDEARAAAEKVRRETEETPAFVVVMCAQHPDDRIREEDYAAAMMATENLMIAAESLGLGTYLKTGGIMQAPDLAAMVGLEPGFRVVAVVSVGYPVEAEAPRRRRPAEGFTRWVDT
jgi:nitroreductase